TQDKQTIQERSLHDVLPIKSVSILPTANWGIKAVRADTSHYDGSGVTVAVLDTGIDRDHPAFAGITLVEKDFSDHGNGDRHGHRSEEHTSALQSRENLVCRF